MPTTNGVPSSSRTLFAELDALHRVYDLADRLRACADMRAVLKQMLDAALELLGACSGDVRLHQKSTGMLDLVAQQGIRGEFMDYFRASGTDEEVLCEKTLKRGKRVLIDDVQGDAGFGHLYRKIASATGYRTLLVTPIIGRDGVPIAVLCAHFRQPHRPPARELCMLDLYLQQAAALVGQMRAEHALHASRASGEARFRALAEAAPVLVWQLDPDGNAVFLNRRCLEQAGRREHDLMRRGWQALVHPDDASGFLAALAHARCERERLRQRVRLRCCRDNCWRLFETHAQPWFDGGGQYAGHVVVSIDITDAVRSEQTQTTYRMATEGGDEGFFIVRPVHDGNNTIVDFEFIDSNYCGAAYLGHRREELIGKKMSALYYAGGRLERPMKILRRTMDIGFFEDDVEVARGGPLHHRWFHCKIVRSQGDLAITLRDISAAKALVDELERRGNEDALTGLPNRHWLQDYLPGAIRRTVEDMSELALLFMDLDGFKQVNDSIGHPAGDELLKAAAHRLKIAVRPQDKVVRLGGDEFVIILEHLVHRTDAAQVAARILHAFDEEFMLSQGNCSVGTSIGISLFPADARDTDTLLRHADLAMYAVKSDGKRNFRFFTPQCDTHAHLV